MDEQQHRRRRQRRPDEVQETEREAPSFADDGNVFYDPYARQPQEEPDKTEEKPLPKPLRAISAADQIICKIGDFCLAVIKWTGVAALFAAGFAADGTKRFLKKVKPILRSDGRKKLSSAVHTGMRVRKRPAQPAQAAEEVTLVAIRPEEYKGMGEKRSHKPHHGQPHTHTQPRRKRVVRAPKKKVSPVYSAAMAVLICVALVSMYMISSILWRSISTKRLSDSLSERYSQLSGEQGAETEERPVEISAFTTEATLAPTFTPEPEATPVSVQMTPAPKKKDIVRSTKYHQVGGDALPEMEALYRDNRDLTGWLRMEGILDLPVVYKDNSYYLTRDFYKKKSASGTLFLDENHPFREDAQNLLLHGHNMKDGTMFGRLVQYETNLQFLKNNPFIQYSTLWKKEQYVIFAVLHVSLDVKSEDFFNYFTHHTFSSDAQFENYVRALQNRSVFSIPVDVDPSDALLTLSTCLDEDRLVIVARRVRNGESKSDLRHLVQLAAHQ